jgi:TolA-binding protein
LAAEGGFRRATATWPNDAAAPGAHFWMGIAYDSQGQELSRVAPRMVSVHMQPGY